MNSKQQLFLELSKQLSCLQAVILHELEDENCKPGRGIDESLGNISGITDVLGYFYPQWNEFVFKDASDRFFKKYNTLCSFNSGDWKSG